jgi:hypothetical protein
MAGVERNREIKRRRKRKQQIERMKRRIQSATASEKSEIARKLRRLTPGADTVIAALGIKVR